MREIIAIQTPEEQKVVERLPISVVLALTEKLEINRPHPDIILLTNYLESYLIIPPDYSRVIPANGKQFVGIFNQYIQDPSNAIPNGFEHLDFLAFVFMYCEESLRSTALDSYTAQIFITAAQKHLQLNLERTLPVDTKTSPEIIKKFEHYLTLVTQYAEPLILALKTQLTDGLIYRIPKSAYTKGVWARRISLAFLEMDYVILNSYYAEVYGRAPNLIAERIIDSLYKLQEQLT